MGNAADVNLCAGFSILFPLGDFALRTRFLVPLSAELGIICLFLLALRLRLALADKQISYPQLYCYHLVLKLNENR